MQVLVDAADNKYLLETLSRQGLEHTVTNNTLSVIFQVAKLAEQPCPCDGVIAKIARHHLKASWPDLNLGEYSLGSKDVEAIILQGTRIKLYPPRQLEST